MTIINQLKKALTHITAFVKNVMSNPANEAGPMPNIKNEVVYGTLILVIFFLVFGLWAGFATLDTASVAQGKVIFATSHRTIEHLEGGIVKKLAVQEGSIVKKGDVLIELDDTLAKAKYDSLKNQANSLYGNTARLTALLTDAKTIEFPPELLKQKADPAVNTILQTQLALFESEQRSYVEQLAIYAARIAQFRQQIESHSAQSAANVKQLKLMRQELDAFELLDKKRIIEKTRLWASQREYARLQGNSDELSSSISETQKKISETQQQQLAMIDNRKKEYYEKLTEYQQKLVSAIDETNVAEDMLNRTKITAPIAGTVKGLQEHTLGGVITPGKAIMDLVPFSEEIVVEVNVNPTDIASVHPGLISKVQLLAYKQRSTPWVEGKVIAVSADTFSDPETKKSYYTARIKISQDELKKLPDVSLYPGMPVEVMIITAERTPWQYLFSPIKDSFNRAFTEK